MKLLQICLCLFTRVRKAHQLLSKLHRRTLKNISEYSQKDNTLDTYATLFIIVHMFQINRSLDTTNEKIINFKLGKYFRRNRIIVAK